MPHVMCYVSHDISLNGTIKSNPKIYLPKKLNPKKEEEKNLKSKYFILVVVENE